MRQFVGISTFEFNLNGARKMRVDPASYDQLNSGFRRATRTPTLDGGAVVYDAGYAVADKTLSLRIIARDTYTGAWIAYICKTYNLVRICVKGAVYKAVPYRWSEANGVVTFEALVMEQLA